MYRVIKRERNGKETEIPLPRDTLECVCGWMEAHTAGNRKDCRYFLTKPSLAVGDRFYSASGPEGALFVVRWGPDKQ